MPIDEFPTGGFFFTETVTDSEYFRSHSMNTYVSQLMLQNNQRIYRSVFEKDEIQYVYVDFAFYNKKFDEEEWEAEVEFILYKLGSHMPDMLDCTEKNITVGKGENIVTVSDHYGSDEPGKKLEKGVYRYEVSINNDLAEYHYFHVQDNGVVKPGVNPYFNVYSLRLFESGSEPREYGDRHYLKCFRHDSTRMVWAELEIENLLQGKDWMGEFTFRYLNDAKMVVGERNLVLPVSTLGQNRNFRVETSVGNDTSITWFHDHYTVEVFFMGVKVAATAFEVDDKEQYGTTKLEICTKKTETVKVQVKEDLPQPESAKDTLDKKGELPDEAELLADFEHLVGLDAIREKIKEYIAFVRFRQLMARKGMETKEPINIHACFMGNPGTGKTTVARMLGKIYKRLGLLSTDRVYEADRSNLIGRFIGDTAPMVKDVIEKARGGILFIDEAYALSRKHDEKDFGKEALEIILKEMSDGPGDLAIIAAGYPKEMKHFLEYNPGLRSRFQNIYDFPDYLPDELMHIARIKAARKKLLIHEDAEYIIHQILSEEYRNRDKSFGNARLVGSVIESAQLNLGVRIMKHKKPEKLPLETICTIRKEDVECISVKPGAVRPNLPINEELLKISQDKLQAMTGIERVKQEVNDLVSLVRYQKEINRDILNSLSLHNVFLGNPGTGKTTIARMMAQIFKALGLLERGHLVECNRESLVAGHVGQTAIKTRNMIESAMGGVLFIDEAYGLFSGAKGNDFGPEAIEEILKSMEDHRGRFAVILAGYTQEMQTFLDSNPGLRSRIDNLILFEDYSAQELGQIARSMLTERGMTITEDAMEVLQTYFALHERNKDRFFGNARFVRKVVEKAIRNQLLRMGSTLPGDRTLEMMQTLTVEDVKEFEKGMDALQHRPSIGFAVRSNGKI